MKKNMIKIMSVLMVALMIIGISNSVFATETQENIGKMADVIIGVIQVIGVAVAIIMLIMLGIKYVSAAPSEKADIKKSAVIYVVGAVLLFGASLVLSLVKNLISDFGGDDQVGGVMDMVNQ